MNTPEPGLDRPSHVTLPAAAWLPIGLCLLLCGPLAHADGPAAPVTNDAPERVLPTEASGWMLGVSASNGPSRVGASARETSVRPVLAGKLGRWTLSTSSARRLSADGLAGGINTTLAVSDTWRTGLGVRLTQGRNASDDPLLQGMPRVRSSLAARLSTSYAFTPVWSAVAQWQQDVLHAQGARASLGLGGRWPLAAGWTLDAGAGLTWLNRRAMQTFYGVPTQAAHAGRAAYHPKAGLEQWAWSVGATWTADRHWRVSTSWTQAQLVGPAAASPLTVNRGSHSLQLTVAYAGW